MFSSPDEARADMLRLFTNNFIDLPQPCAIRYQGKIEAEPRGYYVHISVQELLSVQSAFALTQGPEPSPAVYTTSGFVTCRVFAPIAERDAFHYGGLLATKARGIFRGTGTKSGVTFRNARRNEVPFKSDDKYYQWEVIVEFEYDERKQEE